MKLVIGNKNYSSWSMRPWIAMKQIGLAFEEVVIPMNQPETRARMLEHSPTGLVPTLIDGDVTIFETIAIILKTTTETQASGPRHRRGRGRAGLGRNACGLRRAPLAREHPPSGAQA